jgi:four helix bundle protein
MQLNDLEVYKRSLELSHMAWEVYCKLPKQFQYNIGSQFVRSIDSIGANIAEGFGRYHYLDSIKFYYVARGSLFESKHWLQILNERNLVEDSVFIKSTKELNILGVKLNNFINAIKSQKRTSHI